MRPRRLTLPLVLFLAVALTACGGSESPSDDAATSSERADAQTESTEDVDRTAPCTRRATK
jgi:predicted small lipoprotein YifL